MKLERISDIIDFQLNWHPQATALKQKVDGEWITYSSEEIKMQIDCLAQGLMNAGLNRGDKIVIIPGAATPPILFLDLAAQKIGLLAVIMHATFSRQQLQHIVNEVEPRFLFFSRADLDQHFDFDDLVPLPCYLISSKVQSAFQEKFYSNTIDAKELDRRAHGVLSTDLALIIYTSGSTGVPKGVMLTHQNIMSNLGSYMALLPIKPGSTVLSYLPFSHILERAAIYQYLVLGMQVHVCDDMNLLSDYLMEIRPQFMTAVPRVIEKIFEKMQQYKSGKSWLAKILISWSLEVGLKYEPYKKFNLKHSLYLFIARYFVLHKLRSALGGRLEDRRRRGPP